MKKLNRSVQTSYDWCQYMDDADLELWTVRKTVTSDVAKFHTKGEALEYIEAMKKLEKLS